jgi:hypothetical protein
MSVPELETRHEAEIMDPVYRSVPKLAGMDWLIRLEHAWPALATCVYCIVRGRHYLHLQTQGAPACMHCCQHPDPVLQVLAVLRQQALCCALPHRSLCFLWG